MLLNNLCSPALLYLVFSLTQIIIDLFKNLYNTAFLKFLVMIIFTILLNLLCERGLGIISWFIVFIPFIFMTIITSFLLFALGLNPNKGKLQSYDIKYDKQHYTPPDGYNLDKSAYNLDQLSNKYKRKKNNNSSDGNSSDSNSSDGNSSDGNSSDGNSSDGNSSDGNSSDGNSMYDDITNLGNKITNKIKNNTSSDYNYIQNTM